MQQLIKLENGQALLTPEAAAEFAGFESKLKAIKKREDELKAALLAEMEAHSIIKLETPELAVTYVAAADRETFDSKTFRLENPELYDNYVRFSKVKPSLRIKVKGA